MDSMTNLRLKPVAVLAAVLAAALVGACNQTVSSGAYQTRGGGWDNFRAQAPDAAPRPAS